MEQYSRMDPYSRSRYEQGIDSKIVIMGNSGPCALPRSRVVKLTAEGVHATGVGKTSLLQRYTQNKFDPKNTTSTSGAFFVSKKVFVKGLKVRLQLWDTAGQERFRSMVCSLHTRPRLRRSSIRTSLLSQAPMYYRGLLGTILRKCDMVLILLHSSRRKCGSSLVRHHKCINL